MTSVQHWSQCQGYAYQYKDDALFDSVESALRDKLENRTPILADIARLDWMEQYLTDPNGGDVAIWVDSDTYCIDPSWFPNLATVAGFGEECWVQRDAQGNWRRFTSPHNAFMVFARGSPVLPYLRYLSRSIISRVDAAHIAPQIIGPKLLKALHSLSDFTLYPEAGALSPALLDELTTENGSALRCYHLGQRPALKMVNLCQSLIINEQRIAAVNRLLAEPQRFEFLAATPKR